jgi:hypothetical protein
MSQFKISKARLAQIIKEEYEKILLEDEQRTDEGYMDALDRSRDEEDRERRRQMRRIRDEEERNRRSGGYRRPGAGSGMGGIGGGGSGKKRFPGFNRKDEEMDPVGKEDEDVDNDGDVDSSDKYLKKRRKAIGKAMKKESLDSIRDLIQKELKNL